jgi:subtilase family serine protease
MSVDLWFTSVFAPLTGILNETIQVEWTVLNFGDTEASNSGFDAIYLSDDEFLDNSDEFIFDNYDYIPLASGASYTITQDITLYSAFAGNRYLIFAADYIDAQDETDETNNIQAVAIQLNAPDLVVVDATAPTSAGLGEIISVSWTVTNQGSYLAPATWYDFVYISDDQFLDDSDTYVSYYWTDTNTPLAAGDSYTATQSITLPSTGIGDRYLLFVTDPYNDQGETDETNNILARSISLSAPDLVVADATAPTVAGLGDNIAISWTVTNQGNYLASADWYDYVYISDDQVLDNSDTYVSYYWTGTNTPLAAGSSYTATQTLTLPSTGLGDRYLLFAADPYDTQSESDETNNLRSVAINVTVTPPGIVGILSADNGIVTGSLQLTDARNPVRSGSFSDDYTLTNFTVGSQVTLYLSAQFDAYLQLINADTQQIIAFDDDSGPGLDSQLAFTPIVGVNYIIRATSYSGGATGSYTLSSTSIFPDLIVSTATAPTSAILGESIQVSWTTTNQGTGNANSSWYDYVYASDLTGRQGRLQPLYNNG